MREYLVFIQRFSLNCLDPSLVPPGSEKRHFSTLLFSLRDSHQPSLVPNLVPLGSAKSY